MNKIPNGIVTFLFTDIEGSTKLAQEYHSTIQSVLKRHHDILSETVESNNGFVFKIIGDAFCCAFENSSDAVNAAVEAQVKLNSENWEEVEIKVRMGIHSGNAEWSGTDYMGYITLARTSRVMSAAYGEQILISNDAYEKLNVPNQPAPTQAGEIGNERSEKSPDWERNEKNISFRDLGERRLKDVIQPIRLYQILSKGLREDFPPLKTLDARPNNLPIQLTSFIGRENVMQQIKNHLKNSQLVTLLGTGGAGKTRTALQVGADMIDEFENGVFITELAPVSDPVMIVKTVMDSIGIKEEPGKSLEETLINNLKNKELLLILDNCEHLVHESANLSNKLLIKCPKLKIIATSREALNCFGEQIYRVPSLSLPDISEINTTESLTQYEAVRLFIERALSVNPNFRVNNENAPALAQICFQLDGIPLAIELAAVRTKLLTLNNISIRLDKRFKLLTGGKRTALPRQQTLKALIDWSYDLLTDHEKKLWSRLSVFSGGWTLEAVEEICCDEEISKDEILDLLSSLSEKSVIIYDIEKERYSILETIKQYGKEKLNDANETIETKTKHLNYYLEFSENVNLKLSGNEGHIWMDRLEKDHENLQTAISCSVSCGEKEKGLRLALALSTFWKTRGYYSTGRRMIEGISSGNEDRISKSLIAKALNWSGIFAKWQGEFDQSLKLIKNSLKLNQELGDKSGIALSLDSLGVIESNLGNYEQAKKYYDESLELRRELGDKRDIAISVNDLGNLEINRGNFETALKIFEEGLLLRRELGYKPDIASSLLSLGNISVSRNEYDRAELYYNECLLLYRQIGDKNGIAYTLNNLGNISISKGNFEAAQKFFEESHALNLEMGNKSGTASSLNSLGLLATGKGNFDEAQKCLEESLTLFRDMRYKLGIAVTLGSLGDIAFVMGNDEQSQKFFEESLVLSRETGSKRDIAYALCGLGKFACKQGNYLQAKNFLKESLSLSLEREDKIGIAESLIGFASILIHTDHLTRVVKLLGAVESALQSINTNLQGAELKLQKQIVSMLHEKLSDKEFEKYFEEGKKLKIEEAAQLIVNS